MNGCGWWLREYCSWNPKCVIWKIFNMFDFLGISLRSTTANLVTFNKTMTIFDIRSRIVELLAFICYNLIHNSSITCLKILCLPHLVCWLNIFKSHNWNIEPSCLTATKLSSFSFSFLDILWVDFVFIASITLWDIGDNWVHGYLGVGK